MSIVSELRLEELSPLKDIRREERDEKQYNMTVLVVEERALIRDCLCQRLAKFDAVEVIPGLNSECQAETVSDVDVVLFSVASGTLTETILSDIENIAKTVDAPLVILADDWPASQIISVLNSGVRGFLPSSISSELAVQALRLVKAGGTFVPSSCLGQSNSAEIDQPATFTERQKQVIEAIRRGKPNKIIAYELNMCESTVKVHVRSIMKKLKATNRTQVAYLYRD